jgi:hypothetical protein
MCFGIICWHIQVANSLEGHNRLADDWMRYEQKK